MDSFRRACPFLLSLLIVAAVKPSQLRAQPRIRLPQRVAATAAEDESETGSVGSLGQWRPRISAEPQTADSTPLPSLQLNREEAGAIGQVVEPIQQQPAFVLDPYATTSAPPAAVLGPPVPTLPQQTLVTPVLGPRDAPFRFKVFGEYLLIQPGDAARTSFALPINGAIIPPPGPPVPIGPVARLDHGYDAGFRGGFGFRPNQYSEYDVTYTLFESNADSAIAVDPADIVVLRSLVVHPSTLAADAAFLDATAGSSLDFDLIDVEYRHFLADCSYCLVYVLGGRYAHLEQDFDSRFTNVTTIEDVSTRIRFDGGGIRTGLEGEWRWSTTGLLLYGRGLASFLAGRFRSSFVQRDNFAGVLVSTSQRDDRIVPILDIELGVGWLSPRERWRLSAGYLFSAWYNVVSTPELIQAVHVAQFDDVSDTLTFDGFVARVEFRF